MKHVALTLLLFGLTACVSAPQRSAPMPGNPPEDTPVAGTTNQPGNALTANQLELLEAGVGDYLLGAGDVVQLYAMDVAELNRRYVIGPDGKITVPGVGVLSLDGLTREQAQVRIEGLLKPAYLNPKVSIIVEEYNNNRIFVLGEVRKPGQYNFPGRPLLLSALARAEGLTDKADMRGCTVVRGRGTVIEIDLYDLLRKGDRTLNISLLPEDAVYVKADEEHTFYVLGEVARPGVFARGQQMDVIRAVALAGGETHDAQLSSVRVVRRDKTGEAKVLTANMAGMLGGHITENPLVESGDIVYVPRKGVATFNYYLTQLTPSMNTVLLGATLQNLNNNNKK